MPSACGKSGPELTGNLLQPGRVYYHNQLRVVSPPPRVRVDLTTGQIERAPSVYYLEMREHYTLADLKRYWEKRSGQKDLQPEKTLGALRWLVERYDLDLLLFAIDACLDITKDSGEKPPLTPLGVQDYIAEGRESLNRKITEAREMGEDRLVPRRRLLLAGGRGPDKDGLSP